MFKLLILVSVFATGGRAYATGCDCSCFEVKEQILREDVHGSYHFTVDKDGANLKLIPIPGRYNRVMEPVILSGYKDRVPIHPRLLERIVTEKPRFDLRRFNMRLSVESQCSVENAEGETGRMMVDIRFETGERVTLWHPSDEVLFDRESGEIQSHNLIPFPLNEQVNP